MNAQQISTQHGVDLAVAGGKSGPPLAVTALTLAGIPLEQWVFVATLVYVVLQTAYLVWKWWRALRSGKVPTDG